MSEPVIISDPRVMMGKPAVDARWTDTRKAEHKARNPAAPARSLGWQGRR
jgi:hypothetical protein